MKIEQQLGLNIIRHRKFKHISQETMANRTGISRRYLSDIEHGSRQVSVTIIAKIAAVLGISVVELLVSDQNSGLNQPP